MPKDLYPLYDMTYFKINTDFCRKSVYGLRYLDVQAICGISEPSMLLYDSKGTAPSVSVAKEIAEMYCTTLDRLCSYPLGDKTESLFLQLDFVKRCAFSDRLKYRPLYLTLLGEREEITKDELISLLSSVLDVILVDLRREGKLFTVQKDEGVAERFTKNFRILHSALNVSYREIGQFCDISIGNLTRLNTGAEPKLSTCISLAKYFGLSLSELLGDEPLNLAKAALSVFGKRDMEEVFPMPDEEIRDNSTFSRDMAVKAMDTALESLVSNL